MKRAQSVFQRIKLRLERQEFLRHVLTLVSGTALAQLFPLLAAPLISRLYSPAEMGIFTAFMSLVGGVVAFAAWRYDMAIVLPRSDDDARALVKLASRLNAATSVTAGVLLLLFARPVAAWLNTPQLSPYLFVVGPVSWAFAQALIYGYWGNRRRRYALMAQNRIEQAATTTGTQVGFGFLGFGASGLILSTFLGQLWATTGFFLRFRKEIYGQPVSSLREMMSSFKKMPLLNGPTAVLDSVRLNGVQLLITRFFDSATLGQFGLAWKMLQVPSALINANLTQVFYQRLSLAKPGELAELVKKSIVRSALIGLAPFGLLYLFSPTVFPWVFGARWQLAGEIGAALVPWLYVNFVTSPVSTVFVVARRQGLLFLFGIPFTGFPLLLLVCYHSEILSTISLLSWGMAILLVGFLGLAVLVSLSYDRSRED